MPNQGDRKLDIIKGDFGKFKEERGTAHGRNRYTKKEKKSEKKSVHQNSEKVDEPTSLSRLRRSLSLAAPLGPR